MTLKQQEKEIMEYVYIEVKRILGRPLFTAEHRTMLETIQAILRRYDVFPVEDERRK